MKKLIVANWKMYLTLRQSIALAKKVLGVRGQVSDVDIVLCPSFVALEEVAKVVRRTKIKLGAQDVEPEHKGAFTPPPKTRYEDLLVGGFTGEVGLDDLHEIGVQYVLVGHSERRQKCGETDTVVNKKLRAVLASGMRPILCVGEPREVRGAGMEEVRRYVGTQVTIGLKGISRKDLKRVIIAYEPIWAIGTNHADTPENAGRMHGFIKNIAKNIPVLYGGSVNAKNAALFLRATGIDGLLIGKASTDAREFAKIMRNVQ